MNPALSSAQFNEGVRLARLGDPQGAADCFRAILARQPGDVNALTNLGMMLIRLHRFRDAVGYLGEAVRIYPDFPPARNNLGIALERDGQLAEAARHLRAALALRADLAESRVNLANVLKNQGMVAEAIESLREAFTRWPEIGTGSHYLCALHYADEIDPGFAFSEHRRWGETVQATSRPAQQRSVTRDPERRLRVGYVSADFWTHSVSFFFEPLLLSHNRDRVDVYCYSGAEKEDATTERLRPAASQWRRVAGVGDDQLAGLIRDDAIDILVDLSGHTAGNRLRVFARKPAPIQVTYLGYPATTGLSAIDFRLTDSFADPPGTTEHLHTEQLIRLPGGFLCFRPPANGPLAEHTPQHDGPGGITFGSFNYLGKVSPAVVALWARILRAVPDSNLVLKNRSFGDAETRERFSGMFAGHGIGRDRLTLAGRIPAIGDHLDWYRRLDIALDTFPYNGATTTCEALWMGVPVVTLAGRVHAARVGVSLLSQLGLPELIAADPDEYVRIAVELAADAPRRAALRRDMRARMAGSPLCDAPAFARKVEDAYRAMWREWCGRDG
jgi:predicted O-linked N-acetylglucosamine transferase (SPINDLY family)